jgi:phage tail protein X
MSDTIVTVTVKSSGLTLERIIDRQIGRHVAGVLEAALVLDPTLASLPPLVPAGTTLRIPLPATRAINAAEAPVLLAD